MDFDGRFCADPETISPLNLLGQTDAQLLNGDMTIGKGADGSIVLAAQAPWRDDPNQAGDVIFEGAVSNEDMDQVVRELLFWLQAPRRQVSSPFGTLRRTAGDTLTDGPMQLEWPNRHDC